MKSKIRRICFYLLCFVLQVETIGSVNAQGIDNTLNFDGINDFVSLDLLEDEFIDNQNFTIEFWMQAEVNAQNGNRVALFAINRFAESGNILLIAMGGEGSSQEGKLMIIDQNFTPENFVITSSEIIGNDICHHIAYVREGSIGKAYLDGKLIGEHVVTYSLDSNLRFSLGQEWDLLNISDEYRGNIDELRIWSESKSQVEISSASVQSLTGNEVGLIGYYNFNQGEPSGNNQTLTMLEDLSGNGNHGQLENFALNFDNSNWVGSKCTVNDCNGIPNGNAILDECGICLDPTDPEFNQSCADCNGIPNGNAVVDECGICLDPTNPEFNQSCTDCNGIPNGNAVVDECGICLNPTDPEFNQSCISKCEIFIPNSFSPNNDGINDEFEVYSTNAIDCRLISYRIFDRWGNKLYELSNVELGSAVKWWNGKFQSVVLEIGVYSYLIKVDEQGKEIKTYAGNVSILR